MSFSGQHFTIEHCTARPKPVQQPPPLIIGGSGKPRTVGVAVRFGAEYNASVFSTKQCGELRSVLDRECERQGRDPVSLRFSAFAQNTVIGTSGADVASKICPPPPRTSTTGPGDCSTNREQPWFTATVDEAVERLSEWAAAGAHRVLLQHQLWSDLDTIALIGEEIAPRVRDL